MYSKLDLVNACLRAIGNDTVSALDYPDADTDAAIAVVEETIVDVLSIGWWFNREFWTESTVDNRGRIKMPTGVLSFTTEGVNRFAELVVRSGFLYDKTNHTFELEGIMPAGGLKLQVVLALELEDIPIAGQQYIRTRSRLKFMKDMNVDDNKLEREAQDEIRYLAILERQHRQAMKTNSYQSPKVSAVLGSMASQNNYFGSSNPLGREE